MNLLIIVNKAAAKAQRAWPIVEAALKRADIKYDVYLTTEPGDAIVRTRDALRRGTTSVAVVGGDGTLSEAAEGFFELHNDIEVTPTAINPEASLAILPAGTGDDFARGLTGRRSPLKIGSPFLFNTASATRRATMWLMSFTASATTMKRHSSALTPQRWALADKPRD